MVFYFRSSDGYVIYMGADKYENEDLIKYGLPEDVWFHVEDLSSAHVYLRLNKNERLEDVPQSSIQECSQLVKANSIEGCKLNHVHIIYTRWRNLKKTADMDVGAIGFHDSSKVKKVRIEKDPVIVKQISKTKEEKFPNLAEAQELRAAEFRADAKKERIANLNAEKTAKRERELAAEQRSYSNVMKASNMKSNSEFAAAVDDSCARNFEDDFM
mmetsp:Transcript_6328/g.9468  ORF Transcript_6328/g.9468 Transcript_6328/m.9468 type:complete len:214 (-) Transcript_6328:62-703(-)